MDIPSEEDAYKLVADVAEQPATDTVERKVYNYLPVAQKGKPTIYITKSGAFIKFEYFRKNVKLLSKIEKYFTLFHTEITGHITKVKSCTADRAGQRIIVPRFGVFEILEEKFGLAGCKVESQIKKGDDPETPFEWIATQTPNQEIVSNHIMSTIYTPERVANGSAGLILNMEAGQGKSFLATHLIYKIQKKAAIILHSTSLIKQWESVLYTSFGDDVSVGYYYAQKHKLGDIMIMIIDSATHSEFKFKVNKIAFTMTSIEFYNQFGIIIYDECQKYTNKFSLKALKIAHAPYMLGLSATPDENSKGFDPLVWWELGPILVAANLPGYESKTEKFNAHVHRVMYYGPPSHTKVLVTSINAELDIANSAATINMICEDTVRNNVILDCLQKGLDLGLYMYVFSDRREHLETLRQMLLDTKRIESEILTNDEDYVRIVGGAKEEDLARAEQKSKVIFTTYPYMGTGKSIVKMNGLILATPRRTQMKQFIGRICRLGSDMSIERHIWDICDMRLKCSGQWATRKKYYASKEYTISSDKIKYQDWEISTATVDTTADDGEGDAEEDEVPETVPENEVVQEDFVLVPDAPKTTKKQTTYKRDMTSQTANKIIASIVAKLKS